MEGFQREEEQQENTSLVNSLDYLFNRFGGIRASRTRARRLASDEAAMKKG